jgi:hypothetical protein
VRAFLYLFRSTHEKRERKRCGVELVHIFCFYNNCNNLVSAGAATAAKETPG